MRRPRPRPLRLAAVIPWRDLGRWIWEHLPETEYETDLIFAAPEPTAAGPGRSRLPPYVREFIHLLRRRPRLDRYDVVFTWEMRAALATILYRRLTRQRRAKLVALAPILKGPILKALPVVRRLLADADRIVCFSSGECAESARRLGLPRERFTFLPTTWPAEEIAREDGGFILALGHSNRDYALLVEAVRATTLPVTIVAANRDFLGGMEPSPNVTVKLNTGHHETIDLVRRATFHVIPLLPVGYSSGQTVLLRAMACGKAVVISNTMGVDDYARDGETALFVPPGDATVLRAALLRLWSDPAERGRIGSNAHRAVCEEFSFARFARRLADLAEEITENDARRAAPCH